MEDAMSGVTIAPLHPSLGAEVTGIDLSKPVDEPMRQTLTRALADHLALVFHDQSLTPAQYLSAASAFGPPMEQHYSQHNMPGFPLIGLIWHRNGQQPAEQWHTDHTNRERPPAATILYGVEIPSAGGGTSVANMRAAYVALPEDERRRLDSLKTYNSLDSGKTDTRPEDREKYGKPIEHPMVRTPTSGARATCWSSTTARRCTGRTATTIAARVGCSGGLSSRAIGLDSSYMGGLERPRTTGATLMDVLFEGKIFRRQR